jgi:hypothetical protein
MRAYDHSRAVRTLGAIFALAVVVSVVHYADNWLNYHDYPQPSALRDAPPALIPAFWVAFTAAGLAGYLQFRRGPSSRAIVLLAVYSGSGLAGIGHYLVPGATSMPWWRQAHVSADIACGIAMFAFALWVARTRPLPRQAGPAATPVARS